jgi:hypothetical protein
MTRAAGPAIPAGAFRCSRCRKIKSACAFGWDNSKNRHQSWCRTCKRIGSGEQREKPEYKEWLAAYLARPDVKARRAAADRKSKQKPARRATMKAYMQSIRGRLMWARRNARYDLKRATTDRGRAGAAALIAAITAEIERYDRAAAVREAAS